VFDYLLSYLKKAKRERVKKNFRNYQRSEYYSKVTEKTEYELVQLAEDYFVEELFSENSFEAKQNRAARSNLSNLLLFGADWELYNEFIRGKINCIYPKSSKTIINHNLYINALKVFYKLYESKYGKKPLVYLCIPNGDTLNILYTRHNEVWYADRDVHFFNGLIIGIQSFVFYNVVSSYALSGKDKLKNFGDFIAILCRINKNGLIYRVS
jgi:hypothetical protein